MASGAQRQRKQFGSGRGLYVLFALVFGASIAAIGYDRGLSNEIHDRTMPYDSTLQLLTYTADGAILLVACVIASLFGGLSQALGRTARTAVFSLLASGAMVQIIKGIVGRPRPFLAGDSRYRDLAMDVTRTAAFSSDFSSFPSGHATAAFAVAWLFSRTVENRLAKVAIVLLAAMAAFTRVALWKHFIADVVAGAILGIAVAELFYRTMITRAQLTEKQKA